MSSGECVAVNSIMLLRGATLTLRYGRFQRTKLICEYQSSDGRLQRMTVGTLSRRQLLLGSLGLPLMVSACGGRRTSEQQVVDLSIESDGDFLAFRPDELSCLTGAMVHLTFHHTGRFLSALHNWVLVMPNQMEAVDKDAEK